MKTTIPFSGFYYSIHSDEIDQQINDYFSNDSGEIDEELKDKAELLINYQDIFNCYVKVYTEAFSDKFGLHSLKLECLDSPKYYNYTTDRIFCDIDISDVEMMHSAVPIETLQQYIKDEYTSCSGFISHYPNDLTKWDSDVTKWDHNQVGTLIRAYASLESEYDQLAEYYLMEDTSHNWLYNNMPSDEDLEQIDN